MSDDEEKPRSTLKVRLGIFTMMVGFLITAAGMGEVLGLWLARHFAIASGLTMMAVGVGQWVWDRAAERELPVAGCAK